MLLFFLILINIIWFRNYAEDMHKHYKSNNIVNDDLRKINLKNYLEKNDDCGLVHRNIQKPIENKVKYNIKI